MSWFARDAALLIHRQEVKPIYSVHRVSSLVSISYWRQQNCANNVVNDGPLSVPLLICQMLACLTTGRSKLQQCTETTGSSADHRCD